MAVERLTPQQIRDRLGCRINVGDVIKIEGARILWPNFSGEADKFNTEGDRNFQLHLTQEEADALAADGWNVKCKLARPDDPDSGERCVLKISVKFGNRPPKIVMVGNMTRNRTQLHAGIAGSMDSAEIIECDLSFVPYFWQMPNGTMGVSAYLKTLYCTIQEDELDAKWAEPEEGEAS